MRPENQPETPETLSFIEKARRAQIISCTIETIATLGYANASLAQIAKRAEISKGVISYHFTSKEELIHQVAAEIFAGFGAYMGPKIDAEPTPRRKLQALIESNLGYMKLHGKHIAALLDILAHARPTPSLMTSVHESALGNMENLLRWGQETGEFSAFSPRVMAMVLKNAIDSAAFKIVAQDDFDLDLYTRELVVLFDRATRAESN